MKNFYKLLGIFTLVVLIGFSMVACSSDSSDDGLTGKWYSGGVEIYDFQSSGKLLITGTDMGYTYTVNGNTITVYLAGTQMGTAAFNISGNTLTLTNTGVSGLTGGTYTRQ